MLVPSAILQVPDPVTNSGSQQTGAVALIIGICTAIGVLYSIFRQHRSDKTAADAAGHSAAVEANKQSFAQVLEALSRADKERAALEAKVDELEALVKSQGARIRELEYDNRLLQEQVKSLENGQS